MTKLATQHRNAAAQHLALAELAVRREDFTSAATYAACAFDRLRDFKAYADRQRGLHRVASYDALCPLLQRLVAVRQVIADDATLELAAWTLPAVGVA